MKVLVMGASGHIGSYLVPTLVKENHEVFAVMRGQRTPYGYDERTWNKVKILQMSRDELCSSDVLQENFDVVCDLIAYDVADVQKLLSKIRNDAFYVQIGSIWAYGNKAYLPVDEEHPKNGLDTYGKNKGYVEEYLFDLVRQKKLRATVVHPGHVSGKEWQPINPQGNKDESVYEKIRKGEEVALPFLGLTTLQHVHSYDLAQMISACIRRQDVANGQAFNAVAEKAMTQRAVCESLYARYGQKPNLQYLEWGDFEKAVGEENAMITFDHAKHSPCCSAEKAKRLLGVEIRYSIMDIFDEYLTYTNR